MNPISILLVDDQNLFAESLAIVLSRRAKHIEVVGIAHDGEKALDMVRNHLPNVVLMDIRMPGLNGVEATRLIRQQYPETQVIILTNFDDDEYVRHALQYGATGYLLKDTRLDNLVACIEAVSEGSVLISQRVAKKLLSAAYGVEGPQQHVSLLKELSKREMEVLNLVSKGYSNKEIAFELYISEQTVKNHVSVIYAKIGARNRIHAINIGKNSGLSSLD